MWHRKSFSEDKCKIRNFGRCVNDPVPLTSNSLLLHLHQGLWLLCLNSEPWYSPSIPMYPPVLGELGHKKNRLGWGSWLKYLEWINRTAKATLDEQNIALCWTHLYFNVESPHESEKETARLFNIEGTLDREEKIEYIFEVLQPFTFKMATS